eukprot:CAMPEP_0201916102 /NCGR_PEP_ID=MMETSP0903-20130614/5819_1 /ASSEMBLY_ACC=CAM_ASM_000552 /TAXON_ID=420261 /ORGANISM="Thalassiosira antarctica, Strain CCMP982" /LENGTH=142 /DNA_ID=CAMNT_0048451839 /DNA_START=82 /DNA_END=509 /DNA_ORIENTATION=+
MEYHESTTIQEYDGPTPPATPPSATEYSMISNTHNTPASAATPGDDANNNCKLSRHCPGGDSSECPRGEECYSFLSDCNYIDMIGRPSAGSSSSSSGGSGSDSGGAGGDDSGKVPSNDPSRNNYCRSDWNDALLNCDKDDHW